MAASHCLPVLVAFVLYFPLLLLIAPSWGLIVVPCWFERFCLFCCGPKLVGVAPVSERPRWPFCNGPCLWLMRTLHSVLLSCLGVCYDWCCVVPSTLFLQRSRCLGTCVSSHSLFNCFVFANMFGWCELCVVLLRCLCDRYGCCRGDSSAQFRVAPKTQEKESGVKFASASNLCGPCWSWKSRSITVPASLCNVAERSKTKTRMEMWRRPALDLGWVQIWYFWSCSASELWVTGIGCKFEFVGVSRSCAHSNAVLIFQSRRRFRFRRVFVPRRGCSWLPLWR